MRHTRMPLEKWRIAARINGYTVRVAAVPHVAMGAVHYDAVSVAVDGTGAVVGEWRLGRTPDTGWMDIPIAVPSAASLDSMLDRGMER